MGLIEQADGGSGGIAHVFVTPGIGPVNGLSLGEFRECGRPDENLFRLFRWQQAHCLNQALFSISQSDHDPSISPVPLHVVHFKAEPFGRQRRHGFGAQVGPGVVGGGGEGALEVEQELVGEAVQRRGLAEAEAQPDGSLGRDAVGIDALVAEECDEGRASGVRPDVGTQERTEVAAHLEGGFALTNPIEDGVSQSPVLDEPDVLLDELQGKVCAAAVEHQFDLRVRNGRMQEGGDHLLVLDEGTCHLHDVFEPVRLGGDPEQKGRQFMQAVARDLDEFPLSQNLHDVPSVKDVGNGAVTVSLCFVDYKDDMRFVQVSFLVMIAAVALAAQTATVSRIEASGNERVTTEEILRMSGLKAGQSISKQDIHDAAERLMASGRFERVDYRWKPESNGIVLTFTVREKAAAAEEAAPAAGPRVKDVTFDGNAAIPSQRLRAALSGAVEDRIYDKQDLQQTLDNLLRPLYLERAHWGVSFTHTTEPYGGGVRVRVKVEEGDALTLASVDIDGGDRKWVQSAAFPIGGPAAMRSIQAAVGRVRGNMEREGYLKGGIITQEVVEGGQLRLSLKVDKGPKFTFSALRLNGLDYDADVRARKLWTLKPGDAMNPAAVEAFVKAVFTAHIPRAAGAQREFQIAHGSTQVEVVVTFK